MTLLEHVKERGQAIFGHSISLISYAESYMTVEKGRTFVWDNIARGFRLLLPIPQPDGTNRLVPSREVIANGSDVGAIATSADRFFRDLSDWPGTVHLEGLKAEDRFLDVCLQLGFAHEHKAETSQPYTVRRGSLREDAEDKIDFVLTFSNAQDQPLTVGLQLTTFHKAGHAEKRRKAHNGEIAYLPLDKFFGSDKQARRMMNRAAQGNTYALWLCGEAIRIACQRVTQRPLALPNEQPFPFEYFQETLQLLLPRIKPRVRDKVNALLTQPGWSDSRRRKAAHTYLVAQARTDTIYETSLTTIVVHGW